MTQRRQPMTQQPPRRPMQAQQAQQPIMTPAPRGNTLALTVCVAGLAFVVGSLVTLQLADLGRSEQTATAAPDVTRSAASASQEALDPLPVAAGTVAVEAVAEVEPEVQAVTASASPAALAALDAITEATEAAQEAERQASIDEAVAIAHRNKMRMLTEGVVAGLYTVTTDEENDLVLASVNAASSLADLQTFVEGAAATGEIKLPPEHASVDGSVDSSTIIFDLVQQALLEGDVQEQEAAREMSRRAFAASQAPTEVVEGERFYVVEGGDSLAYIALQFYGTTGAYQQIFEANQDVLESPDLIRVGQRLRIPNA